MIRAVAAYLERALRQGRSVKEKPWIPLLRDCPALCARLLPPTGFLLQALVETLRSRGDDTHAAARAVSAEVWLGLGPLVFDHSGVPTLLLDAVMGSDGNTGARAGSAQLPVGVGSTVEGRMLVSLGQRLLSHPEWQHWLHANLAMDDKRVRDRVVRVWSHLATRVVDCGAMVPALTLLLCDSRWQTRAAALRIMKSLGAAVFHHHAMLAGVSGALQDRAVREVCPARRCVCPCALTGVACVCASTRDFFA